MISLVSDPTYGTRTHGQNCALYARGWCFTAFALIVGLCSNLDAWMEVGSKMDILDL